MTSCTIIFMCQCTSDNPTLREGATLVSCGKLVMEMGITMHLDRAPDASYALSPADEVTGVRLQFKLRWGGGTGLPFDVLLNAPELQVDMQPADALERARETWQIVRVLHQRAQEQLAVHESGCSAARARRPFF